jgi:phage shock protein C
MIRAILDHFERQTFGVCAWLASKMGVRVRRVRLSFIYLSFLTFGSPIFLYLVLKFWKENSHIFKPWKWRFKV